MSAGSLCLMLFQRCGLGIATLVEEGGENLDSSESTPEGCSCSLHPCVVILISHFGSSFVYICFRSPLGGFVSGLLYPRCLNCARFVNSVHVV
ncbi:hypothetical protein KC19_10G031700 [Ceratodon purpureus]|uniref:Secreted protein n=1 Tax=Ceratodon purpureus TaxID=3225 RepID=A0A8T0GGN0_CERPU|nr:hypothetical protein KC19_10G031700 [Ceratodon purpureus]